MAGSLPSPGVLIVENVVLLSGSPTAFADRYGHPITSSSFDKPGANVPTANALLHFLLCVIDTEAPAAFKPCFPILDREQERDFRRVVDARLSLLEKTKLLPVGAARKSIVASAGGDRFIDLLWSLSSLAVQQACLRHPPYGPVSRLRLISHHGRTESNLSYQSSVRSTRSFMSTTNRPTDRVDPSRQRRFLSAGMVSAAQQRSKDAEEMRARIQAERVALARTTESGQEGAKTWASEADSLREKIGNFEAKIRRLKGQLADMGFDENGVDIRKKNSEGGLMSGQITQSSSGDDLGELKTSPIESMESGSSVDELPEPADGEDITADFSKLLTFTADTRESRVMMERALPGEKTSLNVMEKGIAKSGAQSALTTTKPEDIVDLVRAATDELEQATTRMDELQEARRKAEQINVSPVVSREGSPYTLSDVTPETKHGHLKSIVDSALVKQENLVQASRNLSTAATQLTQESHGIKNLPRDESDDSLRTIDPLATISKPTWVAEATADASQNSLIDIARPSSADGSKCSSGDEVDTARDVQLVTQALQNATPRKTFRSGQNSSSSRRTKEATNTTSPRRLKEAAKSSERRQTKNKSSPRPTPVAARAQMNTMYTTQAHLASKTPRSVRFAALPPSYSANRTDLPGAIGITRRATEMFPAATRLHHVVQSGKAAEATPLAQRYSEADVAEPSRQGAPARRPEKKDVTSPKDGTGTRKGGTHHRTPSMEEKTGASRQRSVSNTAPKVPRTQTPRRLVRRKEALQRSFIMNTHVLMRPEQAVEGSPGAVSTPLDDPGPGGLSSTKEAACSSASPRTEEQISNSPGSSVIAVATVDTLQPEASQDVSSEKHVAIEEVPPSPDGGASGQQGENITLSRSKEKQAVEETPRRTEMDAIPKRLFMTPDSSKTVTPPPLQASDNQSKKPGFSRLSLGTMLGRKNLPKPTAVTATKETKTLPSKEGSPLHIAAKAASADEELLYSPVLKLPVVSKPAAGSRSADGVLASRTVPQSEQGTLSRRSNLAATVEQTGKRFGGNSGALSSRGRGGSTTTSSARKSRVQSLKARLAAALK